MTAWTQRCAVPLTYAPAASSVSTTSTTDAEISVRRRENHHTHIASTNAPEIDYHCRSVKTMTDSPAYALPLDPQEQPILDRILTIRDHLSILKQDRSTYVKSQDVVKYYNQLIEQVELLNQIRKTKRDEQNRVDTVLDDCFQLISLFFLTIGRNSEAPAVYSAISTVKRLLDHLKEAGYYSGKDLESIAQHIEKWRESIERGKSQHSPSILTLLEARIHVCQERLHELQNSLSRLTPDVSATYERLVSILRSLSACNTRSRVSSRELQVTSRSANSHAVSCERGQRL